MIEPIDNFNISFKLRYNRNDTVVDIDEPFGFDSAGIELDEIHFAREVILKDFTIDLMKEGNGFILGHDFDNLLNEYNTYGYEANVDLLVYVGGSLWFEAELEFDSSSTDNNTYITIPLSVKSLRRDIDRKKDLPISLLSSKTLDGVAINPLSLSDITIRQKEILFISKYKLMNHEGKEADALNYFQSWAFTTTAHRKMIHAFGFPTKKDIVATEQPVNTFPYYYQSEGGDTYYGGYNRYYDMDSVVDDAFLNLLSNDEGDSVNMLQIDKASSITISIDDISVEYTGDQNSPNHNINVGVIVINYTDKTYTDAVSGTFYLLASGSNPFNATDISRTIQMDEFSQVRSYVGIKFNSGTGGSENGNVAITSSGISFYVSNNYDDSLCKGATLYDIGSKLLENITNLKSAFLCNRLQDKYAGVYGTNGSFLRQFFDKEFTLSWKQFSEIIYNAFNIDVMVSGDDVFAGNYVEFFEDIEVGIFEFKPDIDTYKVLFDEDNIFNKFEIKYKEFEDDDKTDTIDAFHTESTWYLNNKRVANEDTREIGAIADENSIEFTRRDGIDTEPTTVKKEDDKIYMVDVINDGGVLKSRRTEGFTHVSGKFSPETSINLRLSLKRLILDNFDEMLNGYSLYNDKANSLENTYFKVNGNLTTQADTALIDTAGGLIIDKDPVIKSGAALIKPLIYEFDLSIRLKWEEQKELFDNIINQRGYITLFNSDSEIKLYPKKGTKYDNINESLKIVGVLKEKNIIDNGDSLTVKKQNS